MCQNRSRCRPVPTSSGRISIVSSWQILNLCSTTKSTSSSVPMSTDLYRIRRFAKDLLVRLWRKTLRWAGLYRVRLFRCHHHGLQCASMSPWSMQRLMNALNDSGLLKTSHRLAVKPSTKKRARRIFEPQFLATPTGDFMSAYRFASSILY